MDNHKGCLLVDFDGTIVEHEFPEIGKPLPRAFEVLKKLQQIGWKLILWTCRENLPGKPKYLQLAVDFCRTNGLEFDSVNETMKDYDFRCDYNIPLRKPYVTWQIDDTNVGGCIGWDKVEELLVK